MGAHTPSDSTQAVTDCIHELRGRVLKAVTALMMIRAMVANLAQGGPLDPGDGLGSSGLDMVGEVMPHRRAYSQRKQWEYKWSGP